MLNFISSGQFLIFAWIIHEWLISELGDNQVAEKTVTVPPSPFDPLAEQTALVDGVQKYTEYQITVLCFTSPGDGPRSGHVTVKTAEDGNHNTCLALL